jgi:hypothetical protein
VGDEPAIVDERDKLVGGGERETSADLAGARGHRPAQDRIGDDAVVDENGELAPDRLIRFSGY